MLFVRSTNFDADVFSPTKVKIFVTLWSERHDGIRRMKFFADLVSKFEAGTVSVALACRVSAVMTIVARVAIPGAIVSDLELSVDRLVCKYGRESCDQEQGNHDLFFQRRDSF